MPKTVATEWFLRLFTTPDRAAGIAGDMSEEGRVSWLDTLRTSASLFVRNLASQPIRLVLLVLLAAYLIPLGATLVIAPFRHISFGASIPLPAQIGFIIGQRILAPAIVGCLLALLAKGRDLTACVAYVIAQVLYTVFVVLRWSPVEYSQLQLYGFLLLRRILPWASLLIAGAFARGRFLRRKLQTAL